MIDRFCEREGFPTPPLVEATQWRGNVRVTTFTGKSPDGLRKFGLGYEMNKAEIERGDG